MRSRTLFIAAGIQNAANPRCAVSKRLLFERPRGGIAVFAGAYSLLPSLRLLPCPSTT